MLMYLVMLSLLSCLHRYLFTRGILRYNKEMENTFMTTLTAWSVRIRSILCSIFSRIQSEHGKIRIGKTLYLDTFHAVALKLSYFTDCFLGTYRITYPYFYVRLSLYKKKAGSKLFHIIFNCLENGPEKFIRRRFMVTVKLGIFLCVETQYGLVIHKSSRKQSNQHVLTTS